MCKFIGMEALVANALIEIIENVGQPREISFSDLTSYGIKVVELLEKKNRRAVLLLSRYHTNEFIQNFSEYFYITETAGGNYIGLKEGVTVTDLRNRFRAFLSVELLLAFVNEESLATLGVTKCRAS